jgi:hypothetical protein
MHTENDVLAIEPSSHHRGDKELGAVGVGPGIGHGKKARLMVFQLEVLVWQEGGKELLQDKSGARRVPTSKFLAVDGLAASAIVAGEITALKHELRDHTVERGTFVAKTVLAGRELPEVSCGFGDDFVVQLEHDSTSRAFTDVDVKLEYQKKANMSMHATLIDVQERKYVDVVGHGCFGSFDQRW